tara:strand:+ start:2501 stop:3655 length:1155 start_codon:yes stop_codon:yes gene_type:complete
MHIFTYIDSDATMYERTKNAGVATAERMNQNTGLDSIIELEKYKIDGTFYNSRILLKFDDKVLSSSLAQHSTTIAQASHSLKLYTSNVYDIPLKYDVYAYPVAESWEMGVGKSTSSPITQDGVSWKYKDGYLDGSGSHWTTSSFSYSNGDYYMTASGLYGGTYYYGKTTNGTDYTHTQSFEYEIGDLDLDITPTMHAIGNGTFTNNGIIIKRSKSNEDDSAPYGNIQFFSRDTHTMYLPRLETKWDDSSFSTGSLTELDVGDDIILYMRGLKPEYKTSSVEKFKVYGRKRIVQKTYSTSSQYGSTNLSCLPELTYYSVRDVSTDEVVIDFDDYTKVSCNSSGNFFNFSLNTLQPERFYKFSFKVVSGSTVQYFDDNKFQFKVVR